jgi:heptose I phosphotransferase
MKNANCKLQIGARFSIFNFQFSISNSLACRVPSGSLPAPSTATIWIADRYGAILESMDLAQFDDVMNSNSGQCLRVLANRENWYLQGSKHAPRATFGMYLKKHRSRSWATRLAAALGAAPMSPGRVEAENALALQALGVKVMPLVAYGQKLYADGRLESFLLSEELPGYCELQDFIQRRFLPRSTVRPPEPFLRRLIVQVADIARRFHAAGFNHRDFYCCHFLVKETSPDECDVRLIDLQRVQKRRWLRRRWIVKDLAQLASMSPDDRVGCREKILFLRTYLGVRKLRPQDKRLVRQVLAKLACISQQQERRRRRTRRHP